VWIYLSQNKGDFEKEWMLPIDKTIPRDFYFEIDLFETFREALGTRIAFSGHYGTQDDRLAKTDGILSSFGDEIHSCQVLWDGVGNWTWILDGVVLKKAFIPQPENIFPYIKVTYMVMEPFPDNVDSCSFTVKSLGSSNIIIL
jgi:hypothetical protein